MQVLWLRNDLRLHDHPGFALAARRGEPLAVVFILPSDWLETDSSGCNRLDAAKARFLRGSLIDLHRSLDEHTLDLHILMGDPVDILTECHQKEPFTLLTGAAQAPEEQAWLEALRGQGIQTEIYEPYSLFSPAQMNPFMEDFPQSFSRFRRIVEKRRGEYFIAEDLPRAPLRLVDAALPIWAPANWPNEPVLDAPKLTRPGGEREAQKWLKDYIWDRRAIRHYKATRNNLLGDDFSSQMSSYLAWGCLSPRQIWHEILKYEAVHGSDEHSYWLHFELLWREYFHWSMRYHGRDLFLRQGLSDRPVVDPLSKQQKSQRWQAWCEANTGIPMIDAGLKELKVSGFVSNRLRQNMASYFIHQLQLDWRLGANWFEQHLIDYDVASNWGNWAYLAGVGHDPRPQREFNINKQLRQYDPELTHIRHWLPELHDCSLEQISRHQSGHQPIPSYSRPIVTVRG